MACTAIVPIIAVFFIDAAIVAARNFVGVPETASRGRPAAMHYWASASLSFRSPVYLTIQNPPFIELNQMFPR